MYGQIVRLDGFVTVAAGDTCAAQEGLAALEIRWNAAINSARSCVRHGGAHLPVL